ncbi:hypothetical protein GCM10010421_02580 [Streptomyces glaucus]|uniref:Secreted protein n=1 Tax=Streptomyces glaucus TaxID=284029 RepID=A0ABN3J3H1_9ACTN
MIMPILLGVGDFPSEINLLPERQGAEAGHLDAGATAEADAGGLRGVERSPPFLAAPLVDDHSHHGGTLRAPYVTTGCRRLPTLKENLKVGIGVEGSPLELGDQGHR